MSALERFDLGGTLDTGLLVLEASAGTGKTYSLAGLTTRWVAERGVRAAELCLVTFTEAATAELRGRIRDRLVEAAAFLDGAAAVQSDDPVLTSIGRCGADERAERLANVRTAIAEFDTATISTIHGFCSRVLAAAGPGADRSFVADPGDIAEVVNDVLLRRYGNGPGAATGRSAGRLEAAVGLRLTMPSSQMWRIELGADGRWSGAARALTGGQRAFVGQVDEAADLVEELVSEVLARRARSGITTFDSLLTETRALLEDHRGAAVREALRRRYRVVMVDEFQDTDTVQWDIFRSAFLDDVAGDRSDARRPDLFVTVGDPKQSIYRFRGAELSAYLAAVRHTVERHGKVKSLAINWRSDAPLLGAVGTIFAEVRFGDERVVFQPVDPAPDNASSRLGGTSGPVVRLRHVAGADNVAAARRAVSADVVAVVVDLLSGGATIDDHGRVRPVEPADIGILVRSNTDVNAVAQQLIEAGVPASRSSNDSVLTSPAAEELSVLFTALDRPSDPGAARAAALGWFFGTAPAALAALGEDETGEFMDGLAAWAAVGAAGGLPGLVAAWRAGGLSQRLLRRAGGERDLTDLEHLVELLHGQTGGRPVPPGGWCALLAQLGSLTDDAETMASERLARRIDRDDEAVSVMTVHKAKGLEFPIVLCPLSWPQLPATHGVAHAQVDAVRLVNTADLVAAKPSCRPLDDLKASVKAEIDGEAARLLYVAMTRAKHHLVVWSAEVPSLKPGSPLGRLFTRGDDRPVQLGDLQRLEAESGGTVGVVLVPLRQAIPTYRREPGTGPLEVCTAPPAPSRRWRDWSFTGITRVAAVHDEGAPEAPPIVGGLDEPAETTPEPALVGGDPATVAPTPLEAAPGGRHFGTLVHEVFERVDFTLDDVDAALVEACRHGLARRPLPITPERLGGALRPVLDAPLGGRLGSMTLRRLGPADRRNELRFDLALASIPLTAVGRVLDEQLPGDDALRPWAERLASGALAVDVEGTLNGSVDLVARTDGRYWLADYKTNRRGGAEYGPEAIVDEMERHDYPLQALLYLVALHRFLRWRLAGYDPDEHLLGAAYLFVRGMGPGRPPGTAVHWWRPPTPAIMALDRLLATVVVRGRQRPHAMQRRLAGRRHGARMMDVNAEIAAGVDARHDPFHDGPIVRLASRIAGRSQQRHESQPHTVGRRPIDMKTVGPHLLEHERAVGRHPVTAAGMRLLRGHNHHAAGPPAAGRLHRREARSIDAVVVGEEHDHRNVLPGAGGPAVKAAMRTRMAHTPSAAAAAARQTSSASVQAGASGRATFVTTETAATRRPS